MNNGTPGDIAASNQLLMPPCYTVGPAGARGGWGLFRNGRLLAEFGDRYAATRHAWDLYRAEEAAREAAPDDDEPDTDTLAILRAHRAEAQGRTL